MPARRAKGRRRAARPRAPAALEPPAPILRRRIDLREPPHAHAVCRQCGRIAEVAVPPFDAEQLTSFAAAGAPQWAVEGISLSVTGYCPRCRQGLPPV